MNYAIIAAGHGKRMALSNDSIAKPMVSIGGCPMIGRLVAIVDACRAESIAIVVNSHSRELIDYLEQLSATTHAALDVSVRDTASPVESLWSVAGPMLKAGKRVVATTVDSVFEPEDLDAYVKAFASTDADALMAVTPYVDDEKPLYVAADRAMRITDFADEAVEGTIGVSAGIYGLTPAVADTLHGCLSAGCTRLRQAQRALLDAGFDVRAWEFGHVIDVDRSCDIAAANKLLNKH